MHIIITNNYVLNKSDIKKTKLIEITIYIDNKKNNKNK